MEDGMKIRFPVNMFANTPKKKISVIVPEGLLTALDRLGEVIGMNQSETIRWCLEEVVKEAIEQGKIVVPAPKPKDTAV